MVLKSGEGIMDWQEDLRIPGRRLFILEKKKKSGDAEIPTH